MMPKGCNASITYDLERRVNYPLAIRSRCKSVLKEIAIQLKQESDPKIAFESIAVLSNEFSAEIDNANKNLKCPAFSVYSVNRVCLGVQSTGCKSHDEFLKHTKELKEGEVCVTMAYFNPFLRGDTSNTGCLWFGNHRSPQTYELHKQRDAAIQIVESWYRFFQDLAQKDDAQEAREKENRLREILQKHIDTNGNVKQKDAAVKSLCVKYGYKHFKSANAAANRLGITKKSLTSAKKQK